MAANIRLILSRIQSVGPSFGLLFFVTIIPLLILQVNCQDPKTPWKPSEIKNFISMETAADFVGIGGRYDMLKKIVSKTVTVDENGVILSTEEKKRTPKEQQVELELIQSDHFPPKSTYESAKDDHIRTILEKNMAAVSLDGRIHREFITTGSSTQTVELMQKMKDLFSEGKYYEAIRLNILWYRNVPAQSTKVFVDGQEQDSRLVGAKEVHKDGKTKFQSGPLIGGRYSDRVDVVPMSELPDGTIISGRLVGGKLIDGTLVGGQIIDAVMDTTKGRITINGDLRNGETYMGSRDNEHGTVLTGLEFKDGTRPALGVAGIDDELSGRWFIGGEIEGGSRIADGELHGAKIKEAQIARLHQSNGFLDSIAGGVIQALDIHEINGLITAAQKNMLVADLEPLVFTNARKRSPIGVRALNMVAMDAEAYSGTKKRGPPSSFDIENDANKVAEITRMVNQLRVSKFTCLTHDALEF